MCKALKKPRGTNENLESPSRPVEPSCTSGTDKLEFALAGLTLK
jgi:hypothetical protein